MAQAGEEAEALKLKITTPTALIRRGGFRPIAVYIVTYMYYVNNP